MSFPEILETKEKRLLEGQGKTVTAQRFILSVLRAFAAVDTFQACIFISSHTEDMALKFLLS